MYEVRRRKDQFGVDLISDALPFNRLWYNGPIAASNEIGDAQHYSRSGRAVIRVYDATANVIETQEHRGDFKEMPIAGLSGPKQVTLCVGFLASGDPIRPGDWSRSNEKKGL